VLSFSLYIETPSDALNAPNYILELNLSDQMLWKHTAGNRPPQPEEERFGWFVDVQGGEAGEESPQVRKKT
jgi:hypothetical protein